MEEFFNYQPKALGVIIDVGSRSNMTTIKDSLVRFFRCFKSETDDKIYVYDPKHIDLPRRISESVANVANYKELEGFTVDVAIRQAVTAVSQVDDAVERYIIYVTDRCYPSQNWKIEEGLKLDLRYDLDCNFVLATFNRDSWKSLESLYEKFANVQMSFVKNGDGLFEVLKESCK